VTVLARFPLGFGPSAIAIHDKRYVFDGFH